MRFVMVNLGKSYIEIRAFQRTLWRLGRSRERFGDWGVPENALKIGGRRLSERRTKIPIVYTLIVTPGRAGVKPLAVAFGGGKRGEAL
jgi:hypothetical protein